MNRIQPFATTSISSPFEEDLNGVQMTIDAIFPYFMLLSLPSLALLVSFLSFAFELYEKPLRKRQSWFLLRGLSYQQTLRYFSFEVLLIGILGSFIALLSVYPFSIFLLTSSGILEFNLPLGSPVIDLPTTFMGYMIWGIGFAFFSNIGQYISLIFKKSFKIVDIKRHSKWREEKKNLWSKRRISFEILLLILGILGFLLLLSTVVLASMAADFGDPCAFPFLTPLLALPTIFLLPLGIIFAANRWLPGVFSILAKLVTRLRFSFVVLAFKGLGPSNNFHTRASVLIGVTLGVLFAIPLFIDSLEMYQCRQIAITVGAPIVMKIPYNETLVKEIQSHSGIAETAVVFINKVEVPGYSFHCGLQSIGKGRGYLNLVSTDFPRFKEVAYWDSTFLQTSIPNLWDVIEKNHSLMIWQPTMIILEGVVGEDIPITMTLKNESISSEYQVTKEIFLAATFKQWPGKTMGGKLDDWIIDYGHHVGVCSIQTFENLTGQSVSSSSDTYVYIRPTPGVELASLVSDLRSDYTYPVESELETIQSFQTTGSYRIQVSIVNTGVLLAILVFLFLMFTYSISQGSYNLKETAVERVLGFTKRQLLLKSLCTNCMVQGLGIALGAIIGGVLFFIVTLMYRFSDISAGTLFTSNSGGFMLIIYPLPWILAVSPQVIIILVFILFPIIM